MRLFIGAYSSTPALFVFLATNMLLFGRKKRRIHFILDLFALSLQKIGGVRQFESKLSLRSLALSLQKIGGAQHH